MGILLRIRYGVGLALLVVGLSGRLTCANPMGLPLTRVCPVSSMKESILGSSNSVCSFKSFYTTGVIEGDEASLQKALHMVHKKTHPYVAILFYASWCPFSGTFRPSFSILSSLFPSIPHFAIEESAVRPSILSKYGVHGFPTLFLLNSTMRVRHHGPRSLDSLISFYGDISGIKKTSVGEKYFDKIGCSAHHKEHLTPQETCPFPWAKSPENLLQQETYLALATIFVILRLLYFIFPSLRECIRSNWRRYSINLRLRSLWEHPTVHLNRVIQLLNSLKEPCKRSNLQEGAKNAKAWASKSLASVTFGDASSSRDASICSNH